MNDASELSALQQRVAEAEKALEEAGNQWKNLLEVAGDSVFIVDALNHAILEANSHASRRLGYTPEELRALPYSAIEMKDEGGSGAWESEYSRTHVYEARLRHSDGSLIPVEVSSRIIKYRGQAVLLNFVRDIGLRKAIESEREQLIAELDAYAHTVAHDLKNPVAIMMGYSDMLRDFPSLGESEIAQITDNIFSGAVKMQTIIDELLLLASIRKMDDLQTRPLVMQDIVSDAVTRLQMNLEEAGAAIRVPDSWPAAVGYAAWIEEVWANYISNAIKYGGSPPEIELGAAEENGMVTFWVQDNGPGIPAEDQDSLFKQFSRLDTARAQGHGLGLSIVKSIVTKLGGEVGATSEPGQGSTFYFTLPAAG